ncbi:MAG: transglycosylase domain-containing protein [Clostridia bacterium]|nr:transglycosylase domain-containing protein [Clostridia bacterium]
MQNETKHKTKRKIRWVLGIFLALFLVATVGGALFLCLSVSPEEDEALFQVAGNDTVTRIYYNGQGGEAVEGLPGYMAVEWESQRLYGGEICLRTPLAQISPHLQNAFVAIEDHRFYTHRGVDVLRTAKAAVNRLFGSSSFGGSTITQQLIKNIGGEKEKTVWRKAREIARALSLETRHTKQEILEAYLNIVPLSGGYVGVGAASQAYFGKSPDSLTVAEAASLAAITKAPAVYDPYKHPEAHLARRNLVLSRMQELGYLSEREAEEAVSTPLVLKEKEQKGQVVHSWYTETVVSDVKRALMEQGYTEAAATALLYRGGLKIYTAMDPTAQRAVEDYFAQDERFAVYGKGFSAAAVVLSPRSGDLLAVYGGAGKKTADRVLNYATDVVRPPASALKPLALYAPAIEDGLVTEATVFDDVPQSFSGNAPWPRNSPDRYDGLISLPAAVSHSKNTVAVSLYRALGAEHIYATLTGKLGFSTIVRQATDSEGRRLTDLAEAPLALGQLTYGVSLRALTEGYLPLAAEGVKSRGRSYYLVTDSKGTIILTAMAEREQVFSPATASVVTHMLCSVVEEGSAEGLRLSTLVDTAGKTGTAAGGKDRWFIGYTPYYLCGIWCGTEKDEGVSGSPHLEAFDGVMLPLHQGERLRRFQKHASLVERQVCRDSGMTLCEACRRDPRGARTMTVWVPSDFHPEVCNCHTFVYYDEEGDGVVPSPSEEEKTRLERVGLLFIPWRDFPVQVTVADAEYVTRPLGDVPPAEGDRAFFDATLPEGHYAGVSHNGRPFNALARPAQKKKLQPKRREELPPRSFEEERRREKGDPLGRFFYWFFRR